MNYRSPPQTDLQLARTVDAGPDEAYDAWLDTASPGSPWFGSRKVILDPRVDGLFYHCVEHQGREWAHHGRFLVLDRPRRIAHTWVSEGTRGLESVVTLTFEPEGSRTRVTLRHAGVPDDDFGRMHGEGWGWALGAMAERFAGQGPVADREMVHGRLLSASPAEVLRAFTNGDRLARWWGPKGFSNAFEVFEPRPGGAWRFDMIGPDGKRYPNESRFLEVGPERVVIRHLNAPHFVLTVGLAEEGGKTRITWRGLFETAELLRQLRPLITGANEENLDRLEAELARTP